MPYRSSRERMRPLAAALAVLAISMVWGASAMAAATVHHAVVGKHYARVIPECSAPAPGHVGCFALRRVEVDQSTPGAEPYVVHSSYATGPHGGYTPADLWSAYSLGTASSLTAPSGPGANQTIAIVDAYDDPNAEADLGVFDAQYGLPACTTANGCFKKVNQTGGTSLPAANAGWAGEIALDVEAAHAICPNCKILLVEANSSTTGDAGIAVNYAANNATEVSSSYGGAESSLDSSHASYTGHPGVVMTASAGDASYRNWNTGGPAAADAPAAYPEEVAVGGTTLALNADGSHASERVWNENGGGSGGGCSTVFSATSWQGAETGYGSAGCGSGKRLVADVAAIGDPVTGFDIYNSYSSAGWATVGGTSLSSPVVAAMWALAGGAQGVTNPSQTLYNALDHGSTGLYDVTVGGNGFCDGAASCSSPPANSDCAGTSACNARTGFDGPSGVGTPAGLAAFSPVIAKFTMPSTGTHGTPVAVDSSASSAMDGTAITYTWNWGDGSANTITTGTTPNHTFASAGVYTVSLTAATSTATSATKTATIAVDVHAPTTGGQPTVTGTTTNLNTLTEHHAAWTDSPTGYSYQWRRCSSAGTGCGDISGSTLPTHRLIDADVGHTLVVVETATNGAGTGTGATSAPTAVIGAAAAPNAAGFYSPTNNLFATGHQPVDVSVNPTGTLMAVANENDNTVSEFSISAGGAVASVPGSPFATGGSSPSTLAYSPDGRWLAVGNRPDTGSASSMSLTMFAVGSGGALTQAPGSPHAGVVASGAPSGLAFNADGTMLATADGNPASHSIHVYTVASDGNVSEAPGSPLATPSGAVPDTVAFSPTGNLLVATLPQVNKIQEFSIGAGGTPTAFPSQVSVGQLPNAAAFSPGGGLLAVVDTNAGSFNLSIFSVADNGTLTPTSNSPTVTASDPTDLAWSSTGLLAVTGDSNEVYSVGSDGTLTRLPGSPMAPPSGGVTPATASRTDDNLSPSITLEPDGSRPPAIAFSADGTRIAQVVPSQGGVALFTQSVGTKHMTVSVTGAGKIYDTGDAFHGVGVGTMISCPSLCTHDFATGQQVDLYYQPDTGYQFSGWTGDCSGTSDCKITMTADRSMTATFTAKPGTTTTTTPTQYPSTAPVPTSYPYPTSSPPSTDSSPAASAASAPNTMITTARVNARKHSAAFTFAAAGGQGKLTFTCKIDKRSPAPCHSPSTFKRLTRGRHTLIVRAIDAAGHADASPAKRAFKI